MVDKSVDTIFVDTISFIDPFDHGVGVQSHPRVWSVNFFLFPSVFFKNLAYGTPNEVLLYSMFKLNSQYSNSTNVIFFI